MRLSPRVFISCAGGLVVAGVLVSVFQQRETQDLRRQLSHARATASSETIVQEPAIAAERVEPPPEQLLQMEEDAKERDRLRLELKELRAGFNIPDRSRPPPPASPGIDPATIIWTKAGRGTPAATFESTLRSLVESDSKSLSTLIAFDEDARDEATRLYRLLPDDLHDDYANPEDLVAELMVANTKLRATELTVLEETPVGPFETQAKIGMSKDSQGNWRSATFRFHKDAGGWKLMVPALIIDGFRHRVLDTTSLADPDAHWDSEAGGLGYGRGGIVELRTFNVQP